MIGGLFGGAFGRAAQLLLHDPRIDPGAFALVGMGTFYGGIAHTPLSSLVLVCELAGSYDLLVPLMLAEGIAFVALRKRSLYHAQVPTQRDSPVHQHATCRICCARRVSRGDAAVAAAASAAEIAVPGDSADVDASAATIAVPPPVALRADDDLRAATEALLRAACARCRCSTPKGAWSATSTRRTSRGGTWKRPRRTRRRSASAVRLVLVAGLVLDPRIEDEDASAGRAETAHAA